MRARSSIAFALTFGSVVIAGAFPSAQVLAQSQQHTIAGSIHGLVLAEALESGAPIDIAMPHADVKVRNASGAVVGETSTSLAGIFASPLLPAGAYRVCASAVGFSEVCSGEVNDPDERKRGAASAAGADRAGIASRSELSVTKATYARPTVSQLVDGWYHWCGGVNTANCYIDDVGHPFYPNQQACPSSGQSDVSCGWPATWGGALAQSVYQRVPRVYCRTCHVAQANFLNVDSFTDWSDQAGLIKQYVLASTGGQHNYMPFAEVPYNAFWQDFQAQSALAAFLNATGP